MKKNMPNDFAVFILTHGRPDKVKTYDSLIKQGYTGRIYIIVDNEDKTIEEYKKKFKEKVIVFDKLEMSKTFDTGDNFSNRRSIVYARNASFKIAKDLKIKYFMQLKEAMLSSITQCQSYPSLIECSQAKFLAAPGPTLFSVSFQKV